MTNRIEINLTKIYFSSDIHDCDYVPDYVLKAALSRGYRLICWKNRLYAGAWRVEEAISIELNLTYKDGAFV